MIDCLARILTPAVPLLVMGHWLLADGTNSVLQELPFGPKTSQIIGGGYADKNEVPYQVYVRVFFKEHIEFCGGAILDPRHILTAAHCVNKEGVKKVRVIAGDINRKSNSATKRTVSNIFYYSKKKSEDTANDIALLLLNDDLPLNHPNIKAVRLQKKKQYKTKKLCIVSGWGDTQDETNDDFLKIVHLPMVEERACKKIYDNESTTDVICAGYMKGGKDTCQGDSGGPLVCERRLTGVVKGGVGCGLPNYPGNFVKVAYYYPWIRRTMCKNNFNITYTAMNQKDFFYNSLE